MSQETRSPKVDYLEIDLVDIVRAMWRRRIVFLYSLILCLGVGTVWFQVGKDVWVARAKIVKASHVELGEGLVVGRSFLQESDAEEANSDLRVVKIEEKSVPEKMFGQFFSYLSSDAALLGFGKVSKGELSPGVLSQRITVKRNENSVEVEAWAGDAKSAKEDLNQFLETSNSSFLRNALENSLEILKLKRVELEQKADTIYENEYQTLTRALEIARAAGIKDVYKSMDLGGGPMQLALLGERVLSANLKLLREGKKIYGVQHREISKEIEVLNVIRDRGVRGQVYHEQRGPLELAERQGFKFSNVVAFSIVLGLVLGFIISMAELIIERIRKSEG